MGQIFLVRHAQAMFGSEDYDRLSDLGVERARLLGVWFARCGRPLQRSVTGAMKRHRQTEAGCMAAMPDSLKPAQTAQADTHFDEFDSDQVVARYRPEFADAQTLRQHLAGFERPRREFQRIFSAAMARWMEGAYEGEYRESWPLFRERCVGALMRAVEVAGPSQNIVVFTSGGPIAAICQHVLGLSNDRAYELNTTMVNSAVTALLYQPGQISLSYLNNFAHLEETRDANIITYR